MLPRTFCSVARPLGAALLLAGSARAAGLVPDTAGAAIAAPVRFDALWTVGVLAAVLGGLLWSLRALAGRAGAVRQALDVVGAELGVFGAASMLLSVLPGVVGGNGRPLYVLALPALLMLIFLWMLVGALECPAARGVVAWTRRKPKYAFAAALWLVLLTSLIGVPLAGAWSLVWSRDAAGVAGTGLGHLLASRYWSVGCVVGHGGCGSAINSIALGVAVAAFAALLGLALALYVRCADRRLRKWVALLVCLPMITPPFLVGLGLSQVFGQAGIASVLLESLGIAERSRWFFGASGVIMAQVLVFFPIVYFLLLNALDSLSRAQIDAAKFLGASDLEVLRSVSFPALRDSLAVALLVVFVESLSDVGNPLVIGGRLRVLSTELFYSSSMDLAADAMTGAPALLLTAIALTMAAVKESLAGRRRPGTDSPSPAGGVERGHGELPAPLRALCGGLLLATVAVLLTIYAMILIGAFSTGGMVSGAFTVDNFVRGFGVSGATGRLQLSGTAWASLLASISCALFVAPASGLVGMAMVWILQRGSIGCARLVETLSSYLLSVPSVVIGAGFLLVFGHLGLSNHGAWVLILLAMLIRNFAVCMRFGGVALRRIDASLGDISALCGASSLATFRHVIAPLLGSTFAVCVAYGFVRSMTMLGSVLLLSSAENQVATTFMIDRIGIGEYGVAMAYGVVLAIAIALVLTGGWALLSMRRSAPLLASAIGDLKAAVVLAQKDGWQNRPESS